MRILLIRKQILMPNNAINPVFLQSGNATMPPEFLAYAVWHLMSHYTSDSGEASSRSGLASVIDGHLKMLTDAPPPSPALRATCQQLSRQWRALAERTMPRRQARGSSWQAGVTDFCGRCS